MACDFADIESLTNRPPDRTNLACELRQSKTIRHIKIRKCTHRQTRHRTKYCIGVEVILTSCMSLSFCLFVCSSSACLYVCVPAYLIYSPIYLSTYPPSCLSVYCVVVGTLFIRHPVGMRSLENQAGKFQLICFRTSKPEAILLSGTLLEADT